jgi:hypothetical protein
MGGNLWTFILGRDDFSIADVLEMAAKKKKYDYGDRGLWKITGGAMYECWTLRYWRQTWSCVESRKIS